MSSYTHLTTEERKCLQELHDAGKSVRAIARALGRDPSTISRELRRNRSKKGYHFWRAQTLAICRRRHKTRRKLQPGTTEWNYIVEKILAFWSPENVCARWNREHPDGGKLCVSTIYRYIKRGEFPGISAKKCLRRRGKRKISKQSKSNTIHPDRIIPQWPEEIRSRSRFGDWEGDTVYGAVGKGCLVTLVDRKSRLLRAAVIRSRSAEETRDTVVSLLRGLPVSSISFDNGSEFAAFHDVEQQLNTLVYFAEPHKPWQRPTNENTNDLLRFFFPKGYDFLSLSQEDLDHAVKLINQKPRRCLDWRSPSELFPVALT